MTDTEIQSKTAKLAYFYFLERLEKGLWGDETNDWAKAEAQMQIELTGANDDCVKSGAPVSLIKGIGPKAESEFEAAGIHSVEELGELTLEDLSARLPRLASRARSGRWIEQAQAFSTNAN